MAALAQHLSFAEEAEIVLTASRVGIEAAEKGDTDYAMEVCRGLAKVAERTTGTLHRTAERGAKAILDRFIPLHARAW